MLLLRPGEGRKLPVGPTVVIFAVSEVALVDWPGLKVHCDSNGSPLQV
jgi:hypothetical protein